MVQKLFSKDKINIFIELRANNFMNFFGDEDLCGIVPRELSKIEMAIKNFGEPLVELDDFKQLDKVLTKYLGTYVEGENKPIYTFEQKKKYWEFSDWYKRKKQIKPF